CYNRIYVWFESYVKEVNKLILLRLVIFVLGLIALSLGISTTIQVQHLGLHPWDVLVVGLYVNIGLSIGSWSIIIGIILTTIPLILDRSYVRFGTFVNLVVVGLFVDFFLWLDFLPKATNTWIDIIVLVCGIFIMGIGGGLYNSVGLGAGPRDGFMLSISDKTGYSIRTVRITTETFVLVIGLLIGGPVFIFSFIFTFIQSPVFQFSYERLTNLLERIEIKLSHKEESAMSGSD